MERLGRRDDRRAPARRRPKNHERIGEAAPPKDSALAEVLAGIGPARLPEHRLVSRILRRACGRASAKVVKTGSAFASAVSVGSSAASAGGDALARLDEKRHARTHLSHVYPQESSVYSIFVFRIAPDFLERRRALKAAVSEAIVREGGTISHQHGVGKDHSRHLTAEKSERDVRAPRAMVEHFDPEGALDSGDLLPEQPQ